MPVFTWEGVNTSGKKVKGELEAKSSKAVFNALKSQRISPTVSKIREKGKGLDMEIKMPGFGSGVSQKEVVVFTRQFSTMIDAGLPIVQSLSILSKQSTNKVFRRVVGGVKAVSYTHLTLPTNREV